MLEIKIPLKHELRSRANVLTDEAYRETRNYLNIKSNPAKYNPNKETINNFYNNSSRQVSDNIVKSPLDYVFARTNELRELLNKISNENYYNYLEQILKFNYDEVLLENFKVFID